MYIILVSWLNVYLTHAKTRARAYTSTFVSTKSNDVYSHDDTRKLSLIGSLVHNAESIYFHCTQQFLRQHPHTCQQFFVVVVVVVVVVAVNGNAEQLKGLFSILFSKRPSQTRT